MPNFDISLDEENHHSPKAVPNEEDVFVLKSNMIDVPNKDEIRVCNQDLIDVPNEDEIHVFKQHLINVPIEDKRNVPIIDITTTLKDASTQASPCVRSRRPKTLIQKVGRANYKLKNKIRVLEKRLEDLNDIVKKYQKGEMGKDYRQFKKINEASICKDNIRANFLMEQIRAYGKKSPPYEESTLRICCLIFKKSPAAYCFMRELDILHLPHRITLKKFIGHSTGEEGVTSLVKERLLRESAKLKNEHERLGSLIPDEMAIKSKLVYDKTLDRFYGDTTLSVDEGIGSKLATHLLCFVFQGLTTNFRLPVGYFFTANLDSDDLHKILLQVMKAVEECGFTVLRVVADNAKTNVKVFRKLGNGELCHVIPHPLNANRKLFLAFDQSHEAKNLRSQFLSREFVFMGMVISSVHVKKLYAMQKGCLIKPVRNLTRKVVYPTNLEKMNVSRAIAIFSLPVTAALTSLLRLNMVDSGDRENLECTIYFLEMVRKWWEIHDICNTTHGIYSRNANKVPFFDMNDERLSWLLEDFLPFLETIQTNSTLRNERLTDETFEAVKLTTKSTVALIKYLLREGFHFVLTRKLSSDAVEQSFAHIRGTCGFNDQMDMRSCILSIEHTLKIGILKASADSNCNRDSESSKPFTMNLTKLNHTTESNSSSMNCFDPKMIKLTPYLQSILFRMETLKKNDHTSISVKNISVAHVGGYVLKVAEENTQCFDCLERISGTMTNSPINTLINANDRGGLKYPNRYLVNLLSLVLDFISASLHLFPRNKTLDAYKSIIFPHFKIALSCKCGDSALAEIMLEKFIRPLLTNHANNTTDENDHRKKLHSKPLSRKVLKL